ncbi:MAG: hypothetical protein ABJE95_28785 [Byssovorax sp.]
MLTFGRLPDDLPSKIPVLVRDLFDPWIVRRLFGAGVAAVSWRARPRSAAARRA